MSMISVNDGNRLPRTSHRRRRRRHRHSSRHSHCRCHCTLPRCRRVLGSLPPPLSRVVRPAGLCGRRVNLLRLCLPPRRHWALGGLRLRDPSACEASPKGGAHRSPRCTRDVNRGCRGGRQRCGRCWQGGDGGTVVVVWSRRQRAPHTEHKTGGTQSVVVDIRDLGSAPCPRRGNQPAWRGTNRSR